MVIGFTRRVLRSVYDRLFHVQDRGHNNTVQLTSKQKQGVHIYIFGNNNKVVFDKTCIIGRIVVFIWGDNNLIQFGRDAKIQSGRINLYKGATLEVGEKSTFQQTDFVLFEKKCRIGTDCLFSYNITVRNYDGHKIINTEDSIVTNSPGRVEIGDHVWVGEDVTILKNSEICQGSIIGCKALVSGFIPEYSIAAGIPAKVIRKNTSWIRH